jgi:hypothetical protein
VKAIRYRVKIIYTKKISIAAKDRKSVEGILRTMLASREIISVVGKPCGVVAEELDERDCPRNCEGCGYFCPHREDCMMDDVEDRCPGCAYYCWKCGRCELNEEKTCGSRNESCRYFCPECGGCTRSKEEENGEIFCFR